MTTETALLPTTPLDVDAALRAEAERSASYQGFADDDRASRYAWLLWLAEVKLAEANREYLKLVTQRARRRVGGSR